MKFILLPYKLLFYFHSWHFFYPSQITEFGSIFDSSFSFLCSIIAKTFLASGVRPEAYHTSLTATAISRAWPPITPSPSTKHHTHMYTTPPPLPEFRNHPNKISTSLLWKHFPIVHLLSLFPDFALTFPDIVYTIPATRNALHSSLWLNPIPIFYIPTQILPSI